ncbi:MAG TPA: fumarate reductase/succinate dehydrogenase flavoprotein subunit, partial [Candidatus Thermoplasmatota archaeon]|nr:fumarate reductase/succinate dehydrogenase flavoprotein subunit [Candidatus Thermoplasmatota archaeon]
KVAPADVEAAVRKTMDPLERANGEPPAAVHEALQVAMHNYAGMIRFEDELATVVKELAILQERARNVKAPGTTRFNPGWHLALDLHNMLIGSEAIARSASLRAESRGGHTRGDFPETDKGKWSKVNIVCRKGPDGRMQVETVPLPEWPAEVRATIESDVETIATAEVKA